MSTKKLPERFPLSGSFFAREHFGYLAIIQADYSTATLHYAREKIHTPCGNCHTLSPSSVWPSASLPTPSVSLRSTSPPDRGSRPSPARGEGLSVRLSILLCKQVSASVRAFPLTGEGGTRSVTDEGEAKGLLYFTNTSANLHNSCIHCGKCYNPHAALPHTGNRRGVSVVDVLINFILAVSASVIAYYLCKWIDTWRKGR